MNIEIYQSFDCVVLKTTLAVLVIKQLGLVAVEVEGVEVEDAAEGWNGSHCIGEDSKDSLHAEYWRSTRCAYWTSAKNKTQTPKQAIMLEIVMEWVLVGGISKIK